MFCIGLKLQDDFKLIRLKHEPKVPKASKDFLLVLQEESGRYMITHLLFYLK